MRGAAHSPIALEAVKRIDTLFDIERTISGVSAGQRLRIRPCRSENVPARSAVCPAVESLASCKPSWSAP
jgi:hypothetical protein